MQLQSSSFAPEVNYLQNNHYGEYFPLCMLYKHTVHICNLAVRAPAHLTRRERIRDGINALLMRT